MSSEIKYYEYIVVGLGGVGSGALYWLSKRAGKSKQFSIVGEEMGILWENNYLLPLSDCGVSLILGVVLLPPQGIYRICYLLLLRAKHGKRNIYLHGVKSKQFLYCTLLVTQMFSVWNNSNLDMIMEVHRITQELCM